MAFLKDKKFIYPWRNNNAFQLHVDGENYFPLIFNLIDNAKHYVIIEQYLVESGKITSQLIDSLVNAAQRGVSIFLLFDEFGSTGLNISDRKRLNNSNIRLFFYNPIHFRKWYRNLRRNHRKFICIDGEVGFTGGAGFTDEFDTENNPHGWQDIQLQISGPVLNDWLTSFAGIWSQYANLPADLPPTCTESKQNTNMSGRLVIAHTPRHQEINRSLIRQIKHSKQHVWLASPYFVTTRKLRRELKRAAIRGVDVRLLLPSTDSDHPWVTYACHNYYIELLQSGVLIFEYQPRFLHAKIISCDQWVSIGSSNLDRWNRRWGMDANQEINNADFAIEIKHYFSNNFTQSEEIVLANWRKRGWLQRIKEKASQKLIFILDMIGHSYRE